MKKGRIFSIEEFSTFDGPGIRTTVFFKGCPLKCSWCHNPEGQSFDVQILKNPNGCIHCMQCEKVATELTGSSKLIKECIDVCPNRLIRESGTEYTATELFEKIIKNKDFFTKSGGGVTFSGGEPLAQPEFLSECLERFDGEIHRTIQTSGFCDTLIFSELMKKTDLFLFDLKIIDSELSKKYTAADSNVILNNLAQLSDIPHIIRIPLIPEITDTKANITDIINVLKYHNIKYAEALPYNKMAGAKYPLCGREYQPQFNPDTNVYIPNKEFRENNIILKIL